MTKTGFTGNIWDNPLSYKPCRKKMYDAYVCMPPVGTVVINKLMNPGLVKQVGGKEFFTAEWLQKNASNPACSFIHACVAAGTAQIVKEDCFVLCGTVGELSVIDEPRLRTWFTFVQDGQPVKIAGGSIARKRNAVDGTMDWHLVRLSVTETGSQQYMACYVPTNKKGQLSNGVTINQPGVSHGKGDFVVCMKRPDGKPDLSNRQVINGDVFATTFNNQGWANCLPLNVQVVSMATLPKLFTPKVDSTFAKPESQPLMKLRDAFVNAVQSGALVSYNPTTIPEIVTKFGPGLNEQCREKLDDFENELAFGVWNEKERLVVGFTKDCKYIEVGVDRNDGHIKVPMSDTDKAKHLITMISCLQKRGFLSNMRSVPISLQEAEGFRQFTNGDYRAMNIAMLENQLNSLTFEQWLACKMMYNTIKRCRASGVRLWRGMDLPPNVVSSLHAGSIFKLGSFSSWSFSLAVAQGFGTQIFSIVLKHPVEGIYINSLSGFRDSEFEMILNAGYNLKVVSQGRLGDSPLFECEVVRAEDYTRVFAEHFSESREVNAHSLLLGISQFVIDTPEIGSILGVEEVSEESNRLTLINKFGDRADIRDNVVVDIDDEKVILRWFESEDRKSRKTAICKITSFDETINSVGSALKKVIETIGPSVRGSVYTAGSKFMFNIAARFQNEGYQLLSQKFDKSRDVTDTLTGSITISGDNDDHITLRFRVNKDLVINVMARSNNISKRHDFDAKTDTDILYDRIFAYITRNFKLNQYNRVKRVMNLVAQYKHIPVKELGYGGDTGQIGSQIVYDVGGKVVDVHYEGNEIVFNGKYRVYYFDNLRHIAGVVAQLLEEG